jgi:hypothetical protein
MYVPLVRVEMGKGMGKERRKVQMFTAEQVRGVAYTWLKKGQNLPRTLKRS